MQDTLLRASSVSETPSEMLLRAASAGTGAEEFELLRASIPD